MTAPNTERSGFASALACRRSFVTTAEGHRTAYVEAGTGRDVVLIHGILMTADDMALALMATLSPHFHCVAIDRPGHGWSDYRSGQDASLWAQAAIVVETIRGLGLERPVICGHSLGGAVGLACAMICPDEIAGVVALAPICFPEARIEQLMFGARALPLTGTLLSRWLNVTLDPVTLPALWRAMFLPQPMPARFAAEFPFGVAGSASSLTADGESASAFWPDLARSAMSYSGCRVPVRIIAGDADLVVNNRVQGALAAAIIPGASFDAMPGLGHMLHHFRPDTIAVAIQGVMEPAPRP